MILPAQHIRRLAQQGMIQPFLERGEFRGKTFGLGPATMDLRIRQSVVLHPWGGLPFSPDMLAHTEHKLGFFLGSTVERLHLPDDIMATVCDKSSWARKGLAVQNTLIDPGFRGFVTLELSNHGHEILEIEEGEAICQMWFAQLLDPTEMPYKGKYQDQPDRPVPAREGDGAWGWLQNPVPTTGGG